MKEAPAIKHRHKTINPVKLNRNTLAESGPFPFLDLLMQSGQTGQHASFRRPGCKPYVLGSVPPVQDRAAGETRRKPEPEEIRSESHPEAALKPGAASERCKASARAPKIVHWTISDDFVLVWRTY